MGQTVLIALSNQKGGVGKSTIAVTLASYLHYTMGKNVAVIDCDSGQHSLNRLRDSERQALDKVDDYKVLMMEQWERIHKKAYPIVESDPRRVRKDIDALLASDEEYDIIFIDLPGSTSTEGVLSTIVNVDYVLVPIVADRFDMRSSLSFATAVMDFKATRNDIPLKEFLFFWNKVDRRVSTEVSESYKMVMAKLHLTVLDTVIPSLSRYTKEMSPSGKPFFRSTLLPPAGKMLEGSNIDLLADELCKLLNI